jgi:hypothetical protein
MKTPHYNFEDNQENGDVHHQQTGQYLLNLLNLPCAFHDGVSIEKNIKATLPVSFLDFLH